jgi:hypothetical protein
MEKEERTGNGTTLRKKRNHKRERTGKNKRGKGKGKTRAAPTHGRGNKKAAGRPAVGRTSPKADERREAKGEAFSRTKRPTRDFQKSCFVLHDQPSSSISAENR